MYILYADTHVTISSIFIQLIMSMTAVGTILCVCDHDRWVIKSVYVLTFIYNVYAPYI